MRYAKWIPAIAAVVLLGANVVVADDQTEAPKEAPVIKITIQGIHCGGCAKRANKALTEVKNVKSVKVDVESGTATVTMADDKQPSPKSLWEAIEKARLKPIKIACPSGTFTEKPKI